MNENEDKRLSPDEDDIGGAPLFKRKNKPAAVETDDEFAVVEQAPAPAPQPATPSAHDEMGGGVIRKKQEPQKKSGQTPVRFRKNEKQQSHSASTGTVVLIVIVVFVVLLAALIGVGFAMSQRADVNNGNTAADKAAIAADSGHFQKDGLAELSAEGVKGTMLEAYFTKDKRMAVKISLGNGTDKTQKPTKIEVRVVNENEEVVATQEFTDLDLTLSAGTRTTTTLYIDSANVKLPKDDLQQLGCTLTITSEAS